MVSVQDTVASTTTTLVLVHTGMLTMFRVINLEHLFFCCGE